MGRSLAEPPAEVRVGPDSCDGSSEPLSGPGRDDEARDLVHDDLRKRPRIGRDDGPTRGHGLQRGETEPFAELRLRGKRDGVARAHEVGDLVHEPEELERPGRELSSCLRFRRRSLGALADDEEPESRIRRPRPSRTRR